MSFREDAVRAFARLMGVGSLGKSEINVPASRSGSAIQTANGLPAEWVTSTYAPGWPIQPIERPEDVTIPREIDYPLAVNATLQPRTAYGLMPFAALKEAYETVSEIRLPISLLLREMQIFRPHLIDKEKGEIKKHPYEWLTEMPDRVTSFEVWMTRFLKSALVFDAGAFFYQNKGSDIEALRYVDGSTLFIMVDEHGQVPMPNQTSKDPEVLRRYIKKAQDWQKQGRQLPSTTPAYAQVIKGTPFGWYDQNQIWYKPRSRRYDSPYGETTIEQAWAWILICANITGFELAHYREGNMPEGWVSAPEGWSLERIAAFEKAFNQRMSSGAAERMRSRFMPFGSEWHETKKPEFPQQLYDQAANTISLFYGVPPSEYGKTPGSGLGGKGFEEAMQSSLFRMGLYPLKTYVEGAMNEVLKRAGVDDAMFELAFPISEVDPAKHKANIIQMFSNGLITFNNALAQLGQDSVKGGDVHLIVMNGTATILEDFLASGEMSSNPYDKAKEEAVKEQALAEENPVVTDSKEFGDPKSKSKKTPPPTPKKGGEDVQRKEPLSEKDKKLAEKMLDSRSLVGTRFYSFPSEEAVKLHGIPHVPAHPRNPHTAQFASKGRVSSEEAQRIASELGVDLTQISLEQFRVMVEGEANEHPTIVGDDLRIAGQIVLDHLNEGEIEKLSKQKIAGNSGVMVALDLSDKDAKALLKQAKSMIPSGVELEEVKIMHITLFYPGKVEDLKFTQLQLDKAVDEFCQTHAPLKGVIGGLARFTGDGKMTPLVALFDCPELPQFRQDLVEYLHSAGIHEVLEDKHGFIPHITIAYMPADTELTDASFIIQPMPLVFNEVTVAWNDDWMHIPLRASENIQKGGPGSGRYPAGSGSGGGGMVGGGGGEEEYVLTSADRNLIERASEENANSFTSAEKKRLSRIIQAQPPLTRDKVVYRGIDVDADGRFEGEKWKEPDRFISVSTSKNVARNYGGDKVISVKIPKGTPVLDYSNYGYWGQDEILLDVGHSFVATSNSSWVITKYDSDDNEFQKIDLTNDLAKHCGVCEGCDDYYGAPIAHGAQFLFPDDAHVNNVEVIAIVPEGLPMRAGLWKPEGGEQDVLQERVGGALFVREEAAYLLDRSLKFNLVPLAYVSEVNEERGAVVYYTSGTSKGQTLDAYDMAWNEKAAVLDYIMGQLDRHMGNYLTHPDDPKRMILIDNGLSFPNDNFKPYSPFFELWRGKPVSDELKRLLTICVNDAATWSDIQNLVGQPASDLAYARALEVLNDGYVPTGAPMQKE